MSLRNHVFRIHIPYHSFLSKIHISFLIGTHSFSDKINNLLIVSNIHLNSVSRNHGGWHLYIHFFYRKQDVLTERQCMEVASEDGQTTSSNGDHGHNTVLFLRSK